MLNVRELTKEFEAGEDRVHALQGLTLDVEPGEFFTLLGPSGCGKTTTLRCIAGLERPDAGEIVIDGERLNGERTYVPPHKRPISVVFQSYAIWPHMSVFANVAYPLIAGGGAKSEGLSKTAIQDRVEQALQAVGLQGYGDRSATQLSGGQQQRVALARALIRRSKQWLLDEPLSNLDAKLRRQMRVELKHLTQQFGITTLYVTHDQVEALAMSDRIAVMNEGKIVQVGTPTDIYGHPRTRFVADFIGQVNLLQGTVLGLDGGAGTAFVKTPVGRLQSKAVGDTLAVGMDISVGIRPEHIELSTEPLPEGLQTVEGQLDLLLFLGDYWDAIVKIGTETLQARLASTDGFRTGERVFVHLPRERCMALPHGGASAAH